MKGQVLPRIDERFQLISLVLTGLEDAEDVQRPLNYRQWIVLYPNEDIV